jgi:uncharacterized caspase-like protein
MQFTDTPEGALLAAGETRRIALVIGNNKTKIVTVKNGINDARLIGDLLSQLGFSVTIREDPTKADFALALDEFEKAVSRLRDHDIVVFYYAGNGFEIGRTAFLAATDSEAPETSKMLASWVPITDVTKVVSSHAGPKILIVDTCRNDPTEAPKGSGVWNIFGRLFRKDVSHTSLQTQWHPPRNTLLAYSTEPGQFADDGVGSNNGPYALALAAALRETQGSVEDVFRRLRPEVERSTAGRQNPFIESGLEAEVFLSPQQARGRYARVPQDVTGTRTAVGGTERRVALVIGNSNYTRAGILRNPSNDARAVAASFRRLKFDVVEKFDLDLANLQNAVRDFGDKAQDADWSVVYFAGHGIEYDQKPFILPIDARLRKDTDINLEALPVLHILDQTKGTRILALVIMDACRNNPFLNTMNKTTSSRRNVSVSSGLPAVEPEENVLIAYSAKHGFTASDGSGSNSPYVEALLEHIEKPGLEIDLLFRTVRDSVRRLTRNQQQPFTYSSLPGEALFLCPSA